MLDALKGFFGIGGPLLSKKEKADLMFAQIQKQRKSMSRNSPLLSSVLNAGGISRQSKISPQLLEYIKNKDRLPMLGNAGANELDAARHFIAMEIGALGELPEREPLPATHIHIYILIRIGCVDLIQHNMDGLFIHPNIPDAMVRGLVKAEIGDELAEAVAEESVRPNYA